MIPFVKVTLLGPAPFGGTYTTTLDDPTIDRLLAQGHTIYRVWEVHADPVGHFYSVDIPEGGEPDDRVLHTKGPPLQA